MPIEKATEMPFQVCVAPYEPSELSQSMLPDFVAVIDQTCVPLLESESGHQELKAVFDLPVKNRVVAREFEKIQTDLENYRALKIKEASQKGLELNTDYQINDRGAFAHLRGNMDQQVEDGERKLLQFEFALLAKANRNPESHVAQASRVLEEIGHGRSKLEMNDLIHLHLNRDMALFHEANPALSLEEIHELDHEVMQYLIQSTHLQHLRRLSGKMQDIQNATHADAPPGQISEMLEDLLTNASAKRAYNVENQPEYLVFEHYANMLLRSSQVANLDLLRIKDGKVRDTGQLGVVLEAIMGSGKTEVLLPLLGQLCANGDNLCIGVIPEALLADMSQRLSNILGSSFSKSVEVVTFRRDDNPSLKDLKMIRLRLEQAISSQRMLFMGKNTIQSLYLKYWESWKDYVDSPNQAKKAEFDEMRGLLRILKTKGVVMIDESDIILRARDELQFTSGVIQSLPPEQRDLATFIYKLMLDPKIVPDMRFDFGGLASNAPLFTPEEYVEKIVPRLVDQMVEHALGSDNLAVKAFFSTLSDKDRVKVHAYLSASADPEVMRFYMEIEDVTVKDLLALTKQELHVLIPLTANKPIDTYYGDAPTDTGLRIAVPFHGSNNALPNSRYELYETLNYSLQLGLRNSIRPDVLREHVEELQGEALRLIKEGKPYLGSDVHKRFQILTGGDESIKLFEADKFYPALTKFIDSNLSVKLDLINNRVLTQINNHQLRFSADAQVFNFMFNLVTGFTGTQWNADTFPVKLDVVGSAIPTGSTLEILWKNSQDKIHNFAVDDRSKVLEKIFLTYPHLKEMKAFIDTGGMARGIPNETIAKQWLELLPPDMKGVAYYDKDDNLMVLQRDSDKPQPFAQSRLSPEERVTFYDQKHTTGSNIKQEYAAVGLMTVDKHTTLRDLLQSVWRLRGLDRGQKVEFLVDNEVLEVIRAKLQAVLGEEVPEQLELKDIILYLAYNQAMLKGDDNFRSLKQKIGAILLESVMEAVLAEDVPAEDLLDLFPSVSHLCIAETSPSPHRMFGAPQVEKDSDVVINGVVAASLDSPAYKAIGTKDVLRAKVNQEEVAQQIIDVADKTRPLVHDRIVASASAYNAESVTEVENQKEKENETETETETQRESLGGIRGQSYDVASFPSMSRKDIGSMEFFDEKPLSDPAARFINLNSAFANDPLLEDFEGVFDSALTGSLQLIRQAEKSHVTNAMPYNLFNFYQKSATDILVVQDKKSGELKFILGDPKDGIEWKTLLEQDNGKESKSSNARCLLYRTASGPYRLGSDGISIAKMEKDPQFLKLLVQAKFFNGEINYTSDELPHLKEWINLHGKLKMSRLFEKITEFKGTTKRRFPYSDLAGIFRDKL